MMDPQRYEATATIPTVLGSERCAVTYIEKLFYFGSSDISVKLI